MLAKPRLGGAGPLAVEGGVGEDVVPGLGGLDVGCCVVFCELENVLGLDVLLCGPSTGLDVLAPLPLNWNRLAGPDGLFAARSCSDVSIFGLGPASGSSDLRLTPAAALFGVSLTPFVAFVSFRMSLLGCDGFCCVVEDCCGAWAGPPNEESRELKDYRCESVCNTSYRRAQYTHRHLRIGRSTFPAISAC